MGPHFLYLVANVFFSTEREWAPIASSLEKLEIMSLFRENYVKAAHLVKAMSYGGFFVCIEIGSKKSPFCKW